jgi:hypothetical protein
MTKKELLSDELLTIEEVKVYFKKSLSTINIGLNRVALRFTE